MEIIALSKKYVEISILEILAALLVAAIVSTRNIDIGADTVRYIEHFNNIGVNGFDTKYEPGFTLIAIITHFFYSSYEAFFFLISLLITLSMQRIFNTSVMDSTITPGNRFFYSLLFHTALFFSSWFYVAIANGLRHGLALPFLYFALYEAFYNKRYIRSFLFFSISFSFHVSSILIVILLPLFYFSNVSLFYIWFCLAFTYIIGWNENIVKIVSDVSGLGVYEFIKYYSLQKDGSGVAKYAGFDPRFVIYTIFWPILYYLLLIFRRRKSIDRNCRKDFFVRMYIILSCLFFIFGFAPFSNRYAFFSWMLVPIMQILILDNFKIKSNTIGYASGVLCVGVGWLYFIVLLHPL